MKRTLSVLFVAAAALLSLLGTASAQPGVSPAPGVYNNGTSQSYAGVCLYAGANYANWQIWVGRGVSVSGLPGVKIRSHKWVTGTSC